MASEQACRAALRTATRGLGESPTKARYEVLDLTPAASTILRQCGGWNDAKERAGLATNPSTGSRVQPQPAAVDLPGDTTWTELSQDQRRHYRHRDRNTQRTLARRRRRRRWLHAVTATGDGCTRCGTAAPACLDFHHPPDVDKTMAVTELVSYGYSTAVIRVEIAACEVLCANCHAREHQSLPDGLAHIDGVDGAPVTPAALPDPDRTSLTKAERLRTWTAAYKRDRGCQRCSASDPRASSCTTWATPKRRPSVR